MLQPDKRTLLVTGKNYTVIALWMRDRLLKKGLEVICSENEINCSRKVSENEIHQQKYKDVISIQDHFNSFRLLLDTRRDSRIARLHMNKQPIREKLEVYLTADD